MLFDTHSLLFSLGIILSILGLLFCWCLSLLALPGNWLMLLIAGIHAWLVPDESRWDISYQAVAALAVMAIFGELVESGLSAMGVKRLGGSRRGMLLAVVGSIVGAILGGVVGSPILILGTLVGTLLGASFGALAGAAAGELWKGENLGRSIEIGRAAFWGRLLGSMAKLIASSAMLVTALTAIALP